MTDRLMDADLIALVQETAPEDLTLEQIERLRQRLHESPELRDVLIGQLHMESYLTNALSEVQVSVESILQRVDAGEKPHGRGWLLRVGLALGLLLAGAAVWFVAKRNGENAPAVPLAQSKSADDPTAAAPGDGNAPRQPAEHLAANGDDQPNPPAQVAAAENGSPDAPPNPAAAAGTPLPAAPAKAGERPAPWAAGLDPQTPPRAVDETAFVITAARQDLPAEELGRWFEAVAGQPHRIAERETRGGRFAGLEGLAKLRAPWPDGAVLRLGLFEPDHLKIHFWNGNEGVSLHWLNHARPQRWAAYRATREGTDPRPKTLTLLAGDEGRHELTQFGPFELRHQDGALVMTRDDVRLLTVPLAMPPTEIVFEGKAWFSEIALFRGEPFPDELAGSHAVVLQSDHPARLPWYRPATERPEMARQTFPVPVPAQGDVLPGIALAGHSNGLVELSSETPEPDRAEPVLVCTDLPEPGLYEIIAQVDEATPGSGLYLGDATGQPLCLIAFLRDRKTGWTVVAPLRPNQRDIETDLNPDTAAAPYIGPGQWLRIVYGFGTLKLWTSGDGVHWARAMRDPHRHVPGVGTSVGLYVLHDKEPRHIRLRHLEVRALSGITSLASDEVRQQVPAFEPFDRLTYDAWLTNVIATRPDDIALAPWRRACAICGLERQPWTRLSADLLRELIDDVLGSPLPAAEQLRFLADVALLSDVWGGGPARELIQHYAALGRSLARRQQDDAFGIIARALVADPLWTSDPLPPFSQEFATDLLLRGVFAPDPQQTLAVYRRVRSWLAPAHPDRAWERQDDNRTRVFDWAASVAAQALPADRRDELALPAQRWRHPVLSQMSKEGYNVMAEFEAALTARAWDDACQIIAAAGSSGQQGVFATLGLLPDAQEADLLVSLPRAVELAMRDHPELQQTMQDRFGRIGQLRVRQAMAAGDPEAVEAATVQFYGTEAAAEAHGWLGDRALAAGKFSQAAGQYRESLRTATGGLRRDLTARLRLAGSMLGEEIGEPVATAVEIGGVTLTPGEFQSLLSDLRTTRAKAAQPSGSTATPHTLAPKPAAYDAPVRGRFAGDLGNHPERAAASNTDGIARQLAVTTDARQMYVSNRFQVIAYDAKSGKQTWSAPLNGEHAEANDWRFISMRPLVSGDRLYARRLTKNGPELACLNAGDGKVVWRNRPDHHVASDPVFAHDKLMALVAAAPQSGIVQIDIATFHPDTGDVLAQRPLLRLNDTWNLRVPCGIIAAEGKIVCAIGGSVVCCDALGRPQWLRRQAWMPDEIDRDHALQAVQPPVVAAGRVYVTQPGVKAVACLELETGRQFWNRPLPDVRRLLGVIGERVIVQTADGLLGLEAATGNAIWRHDAPDLLDGYLLGGDGGLLVARRIDFAAKQRQPALVWLDPATGRETAHALLPSLVNDTPQLGPLLHAGDKLWAFYGKEWKQTDRELIELVPRDEPPAGPLHSQQLAGWEPDHLPKTQISTAIALPGWSLLTPQKQAGPVHGAELRPEFRGQKNVLVTRTEGGRPVRLVRAVEVPADGWLRLQLHVGLEQGKPWQLTVHVGGTEAVRTMVDDASAPSGWRTVEVHLQSTAGRTVWITVTQHADDPKTPVDAFWKRIELVK